MAIGSQRRPQSPEASGQIAAQIIEGIVRSIALTVEVFLHRGFGSRYVGCGFMGIVVIFFFSQMFPPEDTRALLVFAGVYGAFWLTAMINVGIRRWRKMEREHSLYSGRPHLFGLFPSWNELNIKYLESAGAILLGIVIHHLDRPLGDYWLMASAIVLLRVYGIAVQRRSRAIEMNDAVVEQRLVAEQFREMQGE